MFSVRFNRIIVITPHAEFRMRERKISVQELVDIIETGTVREKDTKRAWVFKALAHRDDNLVCVAVILDDKVVVKTVMINWELKD